MDVKGYLKSHYELIIEHNKREDIFHSWKQIDLKPIILRQDDNFGFDYQAVLYIDQIDEHIDLASKNFGQQIKQLLLD